MSDQQREDEARDALIWLMVKGTPEDQELVLSVLRAGEMAEGDLPAEYLAVLAEVDIKDVIRRAKASESSPGGYGYGLDDEDYGRP